MFVDYGSPEQREEGVGRGKFKFAQPNANNSRIIAQLSVTRMGLTVVIGTVPTLLDITTQLLINHQSQRQGE
jgi:hypothetical protein